MTPEVCNRQVSGTAPWAGTTGKKINNQTELQRSTNWVDVASCKKSVSDEVQVSSVRSTLPYIKEFYHRLSGIYPFVFCKPGLKAIAQESQFLSVTSKVMEFKLYVVVPRGR